MKQLSFTIALLLIGFLAKAQESILIHKSGASETYTLSDSDSLYFNADHSILYLSIDGNTIEQKVSSIDSLTFTENTGNNLYITYRGTTAEVVNPFSTSEVAVQVDGANVTVYSTYSEKDINIICSGTATSGFLKVYSDKRYNLHLNGVDITNPVGPAINLQSDKKTTIYLVQGTTNTLTDGSTYDDAMVVNGEEEDQKATLFAEGDITFVGSGALTVNSFGSDQHAIRTDDKLEIEEGDITITSSEKDGIHTSEGFKMYGGTLSITTGSDGIDGGDSYIEMNGGTLDISCSAEDVNGITCDSLLTINGGEINLTITGDQSNGLKSDQNMYINGGDITIKVQGGLTLVSSGSGYDVENSNAIKGSESIYVNGGTITLTTSGAGSRGFASSGNITIADGSVTVRSSGTGGTYTNEEGSTDAYRGYCFKVDSALNIYGGYVYARNTGSAGIAILSSQDVVIGDGSANPEVNILTTGTSITISSSSTGGGGGGRPGGGGQTSSTDAAEAKAIRVGSTFTINSGDLTITSADDGIKSDDLIELNGGSVTVNDCYEGFEAPYITVNGGDVRVEASDDAFNATNGSGGESADGSMLTINGGYIYLNSTSGDPMDSNGNITVTGGTTVVHGPNSNVEVGIDVNGTALISGGYVIVSGSNSSMLEGFSSSSSQYSVIMKSNSGMSGLIHLEDASGNELFTFKPERTYYSIIFSSDELTSGVTYKLYNGGSYSGTATDGVYSGGTYSGGTLKKSFSLSSKATTISF